jgi:anti-sigma-K factor RskA
MGTHSLYFEQVKLNEKPTVLASDGAGAVQDSAIQDSAELDRIERSNADILSRYPASAMRRAVEEKLAAKVSSDQPRADLARRADSARPRKFASRANFAGLAAAACCVIAVSFLSVNTLAERRSAQSSSVASRLKGAGSRIFVYLKEADGARLLPPETRVAAEDTIQISYIAGDDSFGAIISIDGNGVVTQHYPEAGDMAAALNLTGEIPLDFSYKLDSAPRFERFFLVSGKETFTTTWFKKRLSEPSLSQDLAKAALPEMARATLADTLPAGVHITEILLRK